MISQKKQSPVAMAHDTPISRVMSEEAITVQAELGLDSLREMLLRRGLSRVPVVDATGKAVGIVSLTDLAVEAQQGGDQAEDDVADERSLPRGFHVEGRSRSVGDVMSRKVVSLPATASVAQAAETLVSHHLHGMPVCAGNGVVIGFVSSSDLLGWLAGLR